MILVKPDAAETLRVSIDANGGTTHVIFEGAIDENAKLESIFSQLSGDTMFHMRRVERVNSMGVHRWIPLVTRFTAKHRLSIVDISYPLVHNANVVANLFGSAQIQSCMAPYFCARCNANLTLSVSQQEVAATSYAPPPKKCERCGGELEFDELDNYFAFFKVRAGR